MSKKPVKSMFMRGVLHDEPPPSSRLSQATLNALLQRARLNEGCQVVWCNSKANYRVWVHGIGHFEVFEDGHWTVSGSPRLTADNRNRVDWAFVNWVKTRTTNTE